MPMEFCFYPRHEYACPQLGHCPHLGGAALGLVVQVANENGEYLDSLHRQLDDARRSVSELLAELESQRKELEQVKLELRLERQNKFRTGCDADDEEKALTGENPAEELSAAGHGTRKRGAPVGHPGWFRAIPTKIDETIEVAAPRRCPHCDGRVRCYPNVEPDEHVQEDVVERVYRVVCYRHPVARCRSCRRF